MVEENKRPQGRGPVCNALLHQDSSGTGRRAPPLHLAYATKLKHQNTRLDIPTRALPPVSKTKYNLQCQLFCPFLHFFFKLHPDFKAKSWFSVFQCLTKIPREAAERAQWLCALLL